MFEQQGWAAVWNVVKRKPVWIFLVAAVICAPCSVEAQAINGAKEATKLDCGSKARGETLREGGVEHVPAKPGERGGVDGGAKGRGSSGEASFLPCAPSQIGAEASHKDGANDGAGVGEKGFDHVMFWVYTLIALVPIWLQMFGVFDAPIARPNVEVTSAARLYRAASVWTAGLGIMARRMGVSSGTTFEMGNRYSSSITLPTPA